MNVQFPLPAAVTLSQRVSAPSPTSQAAGENGSFHQALAEASSKPDKLADVAKQFEALMIGQVLKAARESSDGGWLGDEDDQTGEMTLEMAEQGFAQAMANRGVLGIAKLVTNTVARSEPTAASSGSGTPAAAGPPHTDSKR